MCLIVFAYKTHPEFPLIVVANRDEFYTRATRSAHFWTQHPEVFAGRDLESREQGTWIGINKVGRFAAVTNFREIGRREMDMNEAVSRHSRGELTANFLCSSSPIEKYLKTVQQQAQSYKGFNLLLWENENLFYASNRTTNYQALTPGIYGLSNGVLDSAWPKVLHAKQELISILEHSFNAETLLGILMSREQAADHHLPKTGIDIESERLLSPCFIHSDSYGTRASTVLLMHKNRHITFLEQNWNAKGWADERLYLELDRH